MLFFSESSEQKLKKIVTWVRSLKINLPLNPDEIKNIVIAGAHHGHEINRLLSVYKNAHFHAFEAYPGHFEVLKSMYSANPDVSVYNIALTEENKTIPFYEVSIPGSGSILKASEKQPVSIVDTVEVEGKRLDFFNLGHVNLLWCDVQGAELMVLKGSNIDEIDSLFLEIKTREYTDPKDKELYQGGCYIDELEEYLKGKFTLHSIGLDNINHNGTGNSFWTKNI